MSGYSKENLPDYLERGLKSDFEHYKEKYKDILMMKREDGILELKLHTNGGVFTHSWFWHEAFPAALADIGNDPDNQVIILTAVGDKWMLGDPSVWKRTMSEWGADGINKAKFETTRILSNLVFNIDVPIISAINGPGGHFEYALACDLKICADDMYFNDLHFLGGSSPGDGLGLVFQHIMGTSKASYYLYTGKDIDAKTALELGLVNEIMPREKLLDRAWEIARYIMDHPRYMRYVTHQQLMRPWKKILVEDQDMHSFSMTYANLCLTEPPYEFITKMKAIGKL